MIQRLLDDGDLEARLARRTTARLARLAATLRAAGGPLRPAAAGLAVLRVVLAALPPRDRRRALTGADLRGFLTEAETWTAARALAARRPLGPRDVSRLFDRVSRTEHLVTLAPVGRADRGFPPRVAAFALGRLGRACDDLAAAVLGLRLAIPGAAPPRVAGRIVSRRSLRFDLRFGEDAEQGRPAGRIDLGLTVGEAGPLGLQRFGTRLPRLTARCAGNVLTLHAPRRRPIVIAAAGKRMAFDGDDAAPPGGPLRLVRRATIPGTPIVLAPVVASSPRRLRVTRPLPGLGPRLARALGLVHAAWPEAHATIVRRTAMVVPIREPGTVSWSIAARPGISFINVFGKSLVQLADDLLHETAHHRLHDIQEVVRLLVAGQDTEEVQAFDSPWRGARRPLHGLLHGAYTFLFRAELLARLAASGAGRGSGLRKPARRHRLRAEARRELGMISEALDQLDQAARDRLLTPSGRRLLGWMRAWHRDLSRRAARGQGKVRASRPRPGPRRGDGGATLPGRGRSRRRRRAR